MSDSTSSRTRDPVPGGDTAHLVLITGGAGFIGSHTTDALIRAGFNVRIFDSLDPQIHGQEPAFQPYPDSRVELIRGDVRDADELRMALTGASHVFHFAALTGVGQSMYNIADYTDVNVIGTANLLEIIAKDRLPIRRIVLASSRAVYGEGTGDCPNCGVVYPSIRRRADMEMGNFDVFCPVCSAATLSIATAEDTPLIPVSVYGWTKKAQEELCGLSAETYGLPTVALRYFNVFGSRQSLVNPYTGILSVFFNRLRQGQPVAIYEHGTPLRDFVHVSDVAQANLSALGRQLPPGSVFNIGSGAGVTVFDVANALAEAVGVAPEFEDRGDFRVGDIHACVADISQARTALGYQPTVPFESGVREFADWAAAQDSSDHYQRTVDELRGHGLFGTSQSIE